MKNHTAVEVTTVPPCDLDSTHGPAYADASLPAAGGSWAYVCKGCFERYGAQLGLGKGQRLVQRAVEEPTLFEAVGFLTPDQVDALPDEDERPERVPLACDLEEETA